VQYFKKSDEPQGQQFGRLIAVLPAYIAKFEKF